MAVITRQELRSSGKWWTWINYEGFNTFIIETSNQISESEAIIVRDKYLDDHLYDAVPQAIVSVYEYKDVLSAAVVFIKTTNPNMAQWNAYLASLLWSDAIAIRWFLVALAKILAARNEISLADYTESEVLNRLKTFIINTPPRRLAKILFSE